MTDDFEFHDKALDQAVKASASQLKNFQQALNETSDDIRNLEKCLQQCGFCISILLEVVPGIRIGWDKTGDSWRLVSAFLDEDGEEIRPLIETSAKVRMMCKSSLPELVYEISKLLPAAPIEIRKKSSPAATDADGDEVDIFGDMDEIPF